MKDISKKNAEKLGIDTLLWQAQEECGELIKAIGKYNRARGIGQKTEISMNDALDNLYEEISDVEICIEQIKYLMGIEDVINQRKDNAFEKVRKRYDNKKRLVLS